MLSWTTAALQRSVFLHADRVGYSNLPIMSSVLKVEEVGIDLIVLENSGAFFSTRGWFKGQCDGAKVSTLVLRRALEENSFFFMHMADVMMFMLRVCAVVRCPKQKFIHRLLLKLIAGEYWDRRLLKGGNSRGGFDNCVIVLFFRVVGMLTTSTGRLEWMVRH